MKHVLIFVLVMLTGILFAQETTISGKITNYSGKDSLKLQIFSSQTPQEIAIAVNQNGQFSHKISINNTYFSKLYFNPQDFILLVISPKEKISITANFNQFSTENSIVGSKHTELWKSTNTELTKYAIESNNKKIAYERAVDSIEKKKAEYIISFIQTNPTSLASLAIIDLLDVSMYGHIYEFLDSSLMTAHKGNPIVENFHNSLTQLLFLKEGSKAPDIILTNEKGAQVALSSLEGKVVLIDFWATWCRPCRMEIPNLQKAHAKYKNKGFEIYAVSVDNDINAWLQVLAQENMPWITVHDTQKKYSSIYQVSSIPYTVLIDKQGKIIAKHVRGTDLEQYLEQLLAK